MATHPDVTAESAGAALHRMLVAHRTFLESVHGLMRLLEGEMTRRGWDLVKPGSYSTTGNGGSRGLARFDWPVTKIGIAFARRGTATTVGGATNTALPPDGLNLLIFQVRWLDQAAEEPVAAAMALHAESVGAVAPIKWEDHQTQVLNHLQPDRTSDGAAARAIRSATVSNKGVSIAYNGAYLEVPVAKLLSQEDVITALVEPALTL